MGYIPRAALITQAQAGNTAIATTGLGLPSTEGTIALSTVTAPSGADKTLVYNPALGTASWTAKTTPTLVRLAEPSSGGYVFAVKAASASEHTYLNAAPGYVLHLSHVDHGVITINGSNAGVGFFGVTPAVKSTGGQMFTNSGTNVSSTDGLIPDINTATYADTNIKNALYQLGRMTAQDHGHLRFYLPVLT